MEDYGKKIAEYRKKAGMTQQELGNELGVTPQAVSKWEKGLSQPDFDATKKICELFGITPGELLGIETAAPAAAESAAAAAATAQPAVEQKIINGYCERCKKTVGPGEYEIVAPSRGPQHIYCKDCYVKIKAEERKNAERRTLYDIGKDLKKPLIIGGIAGAIVFLIFFITAICTPPDGYTKGEGVAVSVLLGYVIFAFISQMFWGETVTDLFFLFLHSFRMPGVIFTLDIGGLIFLIVVKLGLALLSVILSVLLFLAGLIITPLYAGIIFPFSLTSRIVKYNKQKKKVAAMK